MGDPLIGKTVNERYTIVRTVGEGGMARVYEARQIVLDRNVALKVLHKDIAQKAVAVTRFFREARAAAQLSHSNTIRVFDAGQDPDGTLYMAMELLRGKTLSDQIKRKAPMPVSRAIRIAVQICMSLSEAHDIKLVHRDLKPENVFLTREIGQRDFVKVLDFGIVKLLDDPELLHLTTTGSTPGTPYYMSPEAGMSKPVSTRSDLYSLGCMLFEMLTGKRPFEATNPVQVVVQHLTEPPPFMNAVCPQAAIPERLEAIVARLLSKEPSERYPTAYDVAEVLLGCVEQPEGLFGPRRPFRPQRTESGQLSLAPTAEALTAVDAGIMGGGPNEEGAITQMTPGGPDLGIDPDTLDSAPTFAETKE